MGTIDFPGEADWYSFEADAGDNVFIDLVEGPGMEFMNLGLYDPQGEVVDTDRSLGSGAVISIIHAKLQTGGTYTVRVTNSGVKTGSYTLSLN